MSQSRPIVISKGPKNSPFTVSYSLPSSEKTLTGVPHVGISKSLDKCREVKKTNIEFPSKVFHVVQTREVPLSEIIVGTFTDRKAAEKFVLYQCFEYGDGISSITKNYIPFGSYEEYESCSGLPYYRYEKKPALKILESSLNPSPFHQTKSGTGSAGQMIETREHRIKRAWDGIRSPVLSNEETLKILDESVMLTHYRN